MEKKTVILKTGQKLRSKRHKIVFEVKCVKEKSVVLISEDGSRYLVIPVAFITAAEYEPVYD